ncbi:MAG: hybrid sensor histidine kinase/response regulator [Fibrobacterota bacterium]
MAHPTQPLLRVLLLEDSEDDDILIMRTLRQAGYSVKHERVYTAPAMEAALDTKTWDIVISDFAMPQFNGMQALQLIKKRKLDLPFIIVSGAIGEDTAVEAMKNGAHDYIMKDNLVRLAPAVQRELHHAKIRAARRRAIVTIKRMNEDLLKANEDLKAIDEMKTNLLSNVSHELRTPLVAIRGFTELVLSGESGELNDTQRHQLKISLRNVERLLSLINNLLDFSNVNFGKENLRLEKTDLRELVYDHSVYIQPTAQAKKVKLTLQLPETPVRVDCDREKMGRVFANLYDNALKFTPSGGTIKVIVAVTEGKNAEVSVTDTGPGIPKPAQKRIFERFFQIDSTSTRTHGGIGLGLALCHEIIQLHNGTIMLKSKEGKGSTFTVSLPQVV